MGDGRLGDPDVENDTTCCYALQDKARVPGPGREPWEVYVVKADADPPAHGQDSTCCAGPAEDGADHGSKDASDVSRCCCPVAGGDSRRPPRVDLMAQTS